MQHEQHKPNFVLTVLTRIVQTLPASDPQKLTLDSTLTKFHQAVSTCERMVKTPIPRSYTRYTAPINTSSLAVTFIVIINACTAAVDPA